jgi:hypothetical protein
MFREPHRSGLIDEGECIGIQGLASPYVSRAALRITFNCLKPSVRGAPDEHMRVRDESVRIRAPQLAPPPRPL